jgi:hypothetical protein
MSVSDSTSPECRDCLYHQNANWRGGTCTHAESGYTNTVTANEFSCRVGVRRSHSATEAPPARIEQPAKEEFVTWTMTPYTPPEAKATQASWDNGEPMLWADGTPLSAGEIAELDAMVVKPETLFGLPIVVDPALETPRLVAETAAVSFTEESFSSEENPDFRPDLTTWQALRQKLNDGEFVIPQDDSLGGYLLPSAISQRLLERYREQSAIILRKPRTIHVPNGKIEWGSATLRDWEKPGETIPARSIAAYPSLSPDQIRRIRAQMEDWYRTRVHSTYHAPGRERSASSGKRAPIEPLDENMPVSHFSLDACWGELQNPILLDHIGKWAEYTSQGEEYSPWVGTYAYRPRMKSISYRGVRTLAVDDPKFTRMLSLSTSNQQVFVAYEGSIYEAHVRQIEHAEDSADRDAPWRRQYTFHFDIDMGYYERPSRYVNPWR